MNGKLVKGGEEGQQRNPGLRHCAERSGRLEHRGAFGACTSQD